MRFQMEDRFIVIVAHGIGQSPAATWPADHIARLIGFVGPVSTHGGKFGIGTEFNRVDASLGIKRQA